MTSTQRIILARKHRRTSLNGNYGALKMDTRKALILTALNAFIRQRSGMDWRDYSSAADYRREARAITRDYQDAKKLLARVEWASLLTANDLLAAAQGAFSGRLTIIQGSGGIKIDYCTGQYFPTEYRKAVCAVLAKALWDYTRNHCMPAPDASAVDGDKLYRGLSGGEFMRRHFRREFGPRMQKSWFG